jgi:DNA-binding protein HU-beta
MTKDEFVRKVASETGMSQHDARRAIQAILDTIRETLEEGGEVSLTGFGKFGVSQRGARQGVNPQTRERIQIPASKAPRFTPGSKLKDAVGGLSGEGEEEF